MLILLSLSPKYIVHMSDQIVLYVPTAVTPDVKIAM